MTYIYSYWSKCKYVQEDLFSPILYSIATLRHKTNKDIFVIDYSNVSWENFDKNLNIKIIKKNPIINKSYFFEFQNNVLSRIIDYWNLSKELNDSDFICCDSDILWLEPLNFTSNKFCVRPLERGLNTGCFYFSKKKKSEIFMKKFIENIFRVCEDKEFRSKIIDDYKNYNEDGFYLLNDEAVCFYTYRQNKDLCDQFDYNSFLKEVLSKKDTNYKNIHILHMWLKLVAENNHLDEKVILNNCGLIFYIIKETNLIIKDVLPEIYSKYKNIVPCLIDQLSEQIILKKIIRFHMSKVGNSCMMN